MDKWSAVRRRIFSIIEPESSGEKKYRIYNYVMLLSIIGSLMPLVTHEHKPWLVALDIITCIIFIFDYIARWVCADMSHEERGKRAFFDYPFTPMAIVDLLSILPSLALISPAFKVLRMSRFFKIVRVFKFIRYYAPLQLLLKVVRKEAKTLETVLLFALFYILICALVIFNVESSPQFDTFYDAFYWACCTLTTVGYGDIYPVSDIGRAVSMISSVVGIALVALPSGIITSAYLDELRASKGKNDQSE